MMNVKHSAKSAEWYTPLDIVDRARRVLGVIDLDPATTATANERIRATWYFTKEDDGLAAEWPVGCGVLQNPPTRRSGKFWRKLLEYRDAGHLRHAVVVAYSLEHLATCQEPRPMAHFPLVIARKRIAFLRADGTVGKSPGHANAIAYVPGTVDQTSLFIGVFSDLGAVVNA